MCPFAVEPPRVRAINIDIAVVLVQWHLLDDLVAAVIIHQPGERDAPKGIQVLPQVSGYPVSHEGVLELAEHLPPVSVNVLHARGHHHRVAITAPEGAIFQARPLVAADPLAVGELRIIRLGCKWDLVLPHIVANAAAGALRAQPSVQVHKTPDKVLVVTFLQLHDDGAMAEAGQRVAHGLACGRACRRIRLQVLPLPTGDVVAPQIAQYDLIARTPFFPEP
mmetsp:Transcript_9043/g.27081  ORF Transcript_9043/g.27081 Transcript_9043/m.27081 type:complete len:222 (+) Transcript_9043:154-819(+)